MSGLLAIPSILAFPEANPAILVIVVPPIELKIPRLNLSKFKSKSIKVLFSLISTLPFAENARKFLFSNEDSTKNFDKLSSPEISKFNLPKSIALIFNKSIFTSAVGW